MEPSGQELLRWRRQYDLTQEKAAQLAGVEPNTWARWERGEREVPAPVLRLLIVLSELWAYQPWFWRPWWRPLTREPDTSR